MNTIFPGKPNYTGPNNGLFCFVHHDILYEYSYNIQERLEYIKNNKAKNEIKIRLDCIGLISTERFTELQEAAAELYKASSAQCSLVKGHIAHREYIKARNKWFKFCSEWQLPIEQYIKGLVPDAPWNGKELVFPAGGNS